MSKMTPSKTSFKTIFFSISKPAQKLEKIIKIAHDYFDNNKSLILLAPNDKAASFVDELLWEKPLDSFLPHDMILPSSIQDVKGPIYITTNLEKKFDAFSVFNLKDQPIDVSQYDFNTIYEFEDLSTEIKKKSFQNKVSFYQSHKRRIISL